MLETRVQLGLLPGSVVLCACGCGQPTPIAKQTDRRYGSVQGEPMRFIRGHSGGPVARPLADRLWEQVDKQPVDGCWLFTGAKVKDGYGQVTVGGRMVLAHRLAWVLTHGPIPPETPHVLHNCPGGDNPACVRHLWLGTNADNVRDKVAKCRQARGERHGRAKLTTEQVLEIRRLDAGGGITQRAIGDRFGVTEQNIRAIVTGRNWAWLCA